MSDPFARTIDRTDRLGADDRPARDPEPDPFDRPTAQNPAPPEAHAPEGG
jgi:hypothetical protein